jgi:hypothetical protein
MKASPSKGKPKCHSGSFPRLYAFTFIYLVFMGFEEVKLKSFSLIYLLAKGESFS